MNEEIPNPGSDEAIKLGCKCAVLDNHYGKGFHMQPGVFAISETCKLHKQMYKEATNDKTKNG